MKAFPLSWEDKGVHSQHLFKIVLEAQIRAVRWDNVLKGTQSKKEVNDIIEIESIQNQKIKLSLFSDNMYDLIYKKP